MNESIIPVHFAPLQGYTEAAYRKAHARFFGGVETYYTPFVRVEHGEIRRKDLRDTDPSRNEDLHLVPQLIAPDAERLEQIVTRFVAQGYREADINLGCPFPMLARRHNGSGMLPYPQEVEALLTTAVTKFPDVRFSVKMRLGWEQPDECLALLPLLNNLPLAHVTLHPRLGTQQYKGEVDMEGFAAFYEACRLPLIYNGDLRTCEDIRRITARFPRLAGIMAGRGLLANPALALEYRQGCALTHDDLTDRLRRLHDDVFESYRTQLEGGEAQLLAKMKPFWEYLLPEGDRKARKTIQKTTRLTHYLASVNLLLS